jgi:hypothetical protein
MTPRAPMESAQFPARQEGGEREAGRAGMPGGFVMEPVLHPPTGQPVRHMDGPWTMEGPDMFGDFNILPPNDCGAVAAVVSNMRPPEVVLGNARLIAAAPDLLRVAELLADWLDEEEGAHALCDTARAAIAKARGA